MAALSDGIEWPDWPGPRLRLARTLAEIIRKMITTGRLQDGHELPAECELKDRYGVSLQTVRRAVAELVAEKRVVKQQGRRSRVVRRPHRLVVAVHGDVEQPAVEPVSFDFIQRLQLGRTDHQWSERTMVTPRLLAAIAGMTAGDTVAERTMTVRIGGEAILACCSYIATDLFIDADGWRNTSVGGLALRGYDLTAGEPESRAMKLPTVLARNLGLKPGIVTQWVVTPIQVHTGEGTSVPAAVVMFALSSRVTFHFDRRPSAVEAGR